MLSIVLGALLGMFGAVRSVDHGQVLLDGPDGKVIVRPVSGIFGTPEACAEEESRESGEP